MKIFNFTNGTKGELLGEIKRANSVHGWLVVKGEKVFKVELANAPEGWAWHSGATWLRYAKGEPSEEVAITPEQFGVGAICFSTGKYNQCDYWNWHVLGTTEWNREACKKGILKATFSHVLTSPAEQEEAELTY